MSMIKTNKLIFEYEKRDDEGNIIGAHRAIDEVNLDIEPGQFIAILGHNGSGKSTLAKHMNAILTPTGGTMWVDGKDTKEEENIWDVRQTAGMVFQNPDNQIIGTVVEEDVGFGPENLGVPTEEIWERVEQSLKSVGMIEYRHHSPNKLSGGQKQRVAIAGIIAMQTKCIVLDEPTAMLDPKGRKEVMSAFKKFIDRSYKKQYMEGKNFHKYPSSVLSKEISNYIEKELKTINAVEEFLLMESESEKMHEIAKEIESRSIENFPEITNDKKAFEIFMMFLKDANVTKRDNELHKTSLKTPQEQCGNIKEER